MSKNPFPKRLADILKEWHEDSVREEDCKQCSSACCSYAGFAVLENVMLIYEKYKRGQLVREDYEFPQGLSFTDFVWKYFDIYIYLTGSRFFKKNIVLFHVRSLSNDNHPISIPEGGSYWDVRGSLFHRNPWLNKGCIFLNKKVPNWPEDDKDSSRMCILHTPDCNNVLSEKPIDCLFFTCTKPLTCKEPTEKISKQWRRALAVSYPDSERRFRALIDKQPSK